MDIKRFFNPHIKNDRREFLEFCKWQLGLYKEEPKTIVPDGFHFPVPDTEVDLNQPIAQWINHSTFLIQVGGVNFLTDPIWSKRCSPISFLGPRRKHDPAVSLDALPRIDYVLVSHDHYDHLDRHTVKQLLKRFPEITWVVPHRVNNCLRKWNVTRIVELNWWEDATFNNAIKITAVPTQHFSGRTALRANETLWVGFVVENKSCNKTFYFVGDTGYNPHDFKQIGERFPNIDLSLIPIGSYLPRGFMSAVHIDPQEAVTIHKEVGSKLSIGMHWKTFRLSDEPLHQPPYDLFLSLQKEGIDPATFLALDPGHRINW